MQLNQELVSSIDQKAALAAKFARLFSERKRGGTFSTQKKGSKNGTFLGVVH